jgi:DNA-binding NarL/FixJ family response regulator
MSTQAGVALKAVAKKVRILIADDHPAIRKSVRSLLEDHPLFEVCGEAIDGKNAIKQAEELKPDVVVLNVKMPGLNGFEAAREIRKSIPETAIVMLSANADHHLAEAARQIGVRAYVAKTKAGMALIEAIKRAVSGGDFLLVE